MNYPSGHKRKIAIVSSTRADWGLLSPLAKALSQRNDCIVTIIATNMHISQRFGMTVNNIIGDGFNPIKVAIECEDDSAAGRIKAMSQCMTGMSEVFEKLSPNLVVILGDRYEMLAVASSAVMMRIPIVHIAGGTISEGAIDDSIRHAITKLSALHLTETEEYRRRVIAMGEHPSRVINTGAIGVWNINNLKPMTREELSRELNFDLNRPYVIATFHPATLDNTDPGISCRNMLEALDRHPNLNIILTYPN
ncbi:MAG: UDP-N-acetylglucosamine 2-epimerase (hydrolyzing), partial [Muribaculaceae bacterium]|nr:UDP-N-acetylglucosamine 2-epimerase (hydrolyzing) [Muribaculaceae bacterium]